MEIKKLSTDYCIILDPKQMITILLKDRENHTKRKRTLRGSILKIGKPFVRRVKYSDIRNPRIFVRLANSDRVSHQATMKNIVGIIQEYIKKPKKMLRR